MKGEQEWIVDVCVARSTTNRPEKREKRGKNRVESLPA